MSAELVPIPYVVCLEKAPKTPAEWVAKYGCETPETHNWGCPCGD